VKRMKRKELRGAFNDFLAGAGAESKFEVRPLPTDG